MLGLLTSKSLSGYAPSWNQLAQGYCRVPLPFPLYYACRGDWGVLNGGKKEAVIRDLDQLSVFKGFQMSLLSGFTQPNTHHAIPLLLRQISGPMPTCVIDGTQLILLSAV